MSLPQTLAAARPIDGGFAVTVPTDWMQGRTSYGGFSAALALVAAQRLADDLPPLRSATVNFVGPLAGEVEVRAKVLRRGRNASWISAEVANEAGVGLTATFVFIGPVEASSLHLHEVPLPDHAVPLDQAIPLPERAGPSFAPNFERRFAQPRSDAKVPEILWWERLKNVEGLDPMVQAIHRLVDHAAATDARLEALIAQLQSDGVDCGDAKATAIYAKAYEQSPEFYNFYRSLDAYKAGFKQRAAPERVAMMEAATADLRAGDLVVGAGGRPIESVDDLHAVLGAHDPASPLELAAVRGAEAIELTVRFD